MPHSSFTTSPTRSPSMPYDSEAKCPHSLVFESLYPREVGAEIDRLHEEYRRAAQRALPASLLFMYSMGLGRATRYGITLYHEPGEEKAVKWVVENVGKGDGVNAQKGRVAA